MKVAAHIKSELNVHEITVQTNESEKEITIAPKATGYGSSVNGAELLLLSLATCYCNDIYREANKRNIIVSGVEVKFDGDFGADGEPGSNFQYSVQLTSDAPKEVIDELIDATDKIAEIHTTLRKGIAITLKK